MFKETLIKNKKFWIPIVCVSLLGVSTAGVFYQGVNKKEDKMVVQKEKTVEAKEKIYPGEALENEEAKKSHNKKKNSNETVSDVYSRFGLDNALVTPIATSSLEKSEIEKVIEVIYQKDKESKPSIVPEVPEGPVEPTEPIEPPIVIPPIDPEKPVEPPIEPEIPTPIPVDYSELERFVRFVNVVDFSLYTPQSSAYLLRQQISAEGMLASQSSSQAMVNTQVARLQSGLEQLVEVADFSSLQQLMDEIDQLDLSRYTEETVENLTGIYHESLELIKDKNTSQAQVKTLRTRLYIAKISLKEKDFITPLRDELKDLIDNAHSINREQYLDNGLVSLGVATLKAEAVMALENATEGQLTTEISNLQAALNNLVLRPNKSSLIQTIENAQTMDVTGYTEESVAYLHAVIGYSQATLNDWFATQQEVDSAVTAVETAISQLELYRETLPIEEFIPEIPEVTVPEEIVNEENVQQAPSIETPEMSKDMPVLIEDDSMVEEVPVLEENTQSVEVGLDVGVLTEENVSEE